MMADHFLIALDGAGPLPARGARDCPGRISATQIATQPST